MGQETYLGDRSPTARYASFDYCYNYFQSFRELGRTQDIASSDHVQESCLQLGFYLASWGMLRGSTDLLNRSVKYYVPVIEAISSVPAPVWDIDVPAYTDASIGTILSSVRDVRSAFERPASDTLMTKIFLGVLGCVPAFDDNFRRGFGVTSLGTRSLAKVRGFYDEHADAIKAGRAHTIAFETGLPTHRQYPIAKVIDMVFFIEGDRKNATPRGG